MEAYDGSDVLEYFARAESERRTPLFVGPDHYRKIWDSGLVIPGQTTIRVGEDADEFKSYFMRDRDTVEGKVEKTVGTHGKKAPMCRPGIHSVDDVLVSQKSRFAVFGINSAELSMRLSPVFK